MEPTHTRTTLRRAKAEFKKSGPRIPERELKKFERAAELEKRADELREKEKKRRQAKRKREEKEHRDREAKRRMGIGLATQLAGFSHTQKRMKSGMESFLAKGKDKENVDSKTVVPAKGVELDALAAGNYLAPQTVTGSRKEDVWDAEEQLFDDEDLLAHLESDQEDSKAQSPHTPNPSLKRETPTDLTRSNQIIKLGDIPTNNHLTPVCETTAARSPALVSPTALWEDFLDSNTQITRELSQAVTPAKASTNLAATIPFSTQDLEISSDDLLDLGESSIIANSKPSANDGVVARDFAYFKRDQSGEIILGTPRIPTCPPHNAVRRMKPSKPRSFLTSSPKVTASGFQPSIAERSFTSRFDDFGLSTQMLQDAVDNTDSDTEEEDFSSFIPSVSVDRDRELMPPPPPRTSPKIFKPPSPSQSLKRSNFQAFGLSTQILQDVVDLSDDEAAEGVGSSFGVEDLDGTFWDEAVSKSL